MLRPSSVWKPMLILSFALAACFGAVRPASAWSVGERRAATSTQWYRWSLVKWENYQIACSVFVQHAGAPTLAEVNLNCGVNISEAWQATPTCESQTGCTGLFLRAEGTISADRVPAYQLASGLRIGLRLEACQPHDGGSLCDGTPVLLLELDDPQLAPYVEKITGRYANTNFSCAGASCQLTLSATPLTGSSLSFWAVTTSGQVSPVYSASIRVADAVPGDQRSGPWRVDVLSENWRGAPLPACALEWNAFPPVDGLPDWLTTPENSSSLATDEPLALLAGKLISARLVDASTCADGGVLLSGAASACGMERARPLLAGYQNQFDAQILQSAVQAQVPAALLKRQIQLESQFWPASHGSAGEYGLGQITGYGADTLLMWSPDFFTGFCSQYLSDYACAQGYANLDEDLRAMLRSLVLTSVDGRCDTCPGGVDWNKANASVQTFAYTLHSNCEQVGHMVSNVAKRPAGQASNYVDLWKISLANYNGGSGCLAGAIAESWSGRRMDWETVAGFIGPECSGAIEYVNKLTR